MADPITISSGTVALVIAALQGTAALHQTVRNFQSQDKRARALKNELSELSAVLEYLLERVNTNPELNFSALEEPLHRCGNACKDYGELIARFTRHATVVRSREQDWTTLQYMHCDITEFTHMLSGYKAIVNIALADANLRIAAVTPKALEDYQDMVHDTTVDLEEHLQRLQEKVRQIGAGGGVVSGTCETEWQAILEEKESTQQGLILCAQLSTQIELLEGTTTPGSFHPYPAEHHSRSGLGPVNSSIQTSISRLLDQESDIDKQINAIKSAGQLSASTTTQLAQLQDRKEGIRRSIEVFSDAKTALNIERRNIFEHITMEDDTYNFSISTVGDLVTARNIYLKGRSRHVGGQISNESYQKTIDVFTTLDMTQRSTQRHNVNLSSPGSEPKGGKSPTEFSKRHGPGVTLTPTDGN